MERRPDLIVKKMEALVLHGIGDLRLEQIPVPQLAEGRYASELGSVGSVVPIFQESLSKAPIVFQRFVDTNSLALLIRAVLGLKISHQGILLSSFPCSGVARVRRVNRGNMSNAMIMTISVHGVMVPSLNLSSHRRRI